MRVATWNVRHSARAKSLSAAKVDAIAQLQADVVVLTECALGSYAAETKNALRGIGLEHAEVSTCDGEHNQILIAATKPLVCGYLKPTEPDPFPCNVLHVRTQEPAIDILGLRLPSGNPWGPKQRRNAWDWILKAADDGGEMGCSADDAKRKCADASRHCAESCRAEGLVTDSVPEFSRGGLRNPVSRSLH
jgi:hypothetical protein